MSATVSPSTSRRSSRPPRWASLAAAGAVVLAAAAWACWPARSPSPSPSPPPLAVWRLHDPSRVLSGGRARIVIVLARGERAARAAAAARVGDDRWRDPALTGACPAVAAEPGVLAVQYSP